MQLTFRLKRSTHPAKCPGCGEKTYWRSLSGKTAHPECHGWAPVHRTPEQVREANQSLVDAMAVLANELGPLAVVTPGMAPPMQPEEVGPCARCRRPMRRYGPYSTGTFCRHCKEETA